MRFFQRIRWILDGNSTLSIISINQLYLQMQTKIIYYEAEYEYFDTIYIKFNIWEIFLFQLDFSVSSTAGTCY